jgi:DNA-binding PucR family transcriptional regulator
MYRYLIIESKKDIKNDESMIISLFSEFIDFTKKETGHNAIYLFYAHESDISLSDVILNIMSDTLSDLRLFSSFGFESEYDLKIHLEYIKLKLKSIPFNKHAYLDDKVILSESLHRIDDALRKHILKKYASDKMMMECIKVYLESNQNTSVAAKKLYIHRNTLLQRLDKFNQVTGFDLRLFLDAYLIYHLL